MGGKFFIAIASLILSACISAHRSAAGNLSLASHQSIQYRKALEGAYRSILDRASNHAPPLVDTDAARSMPIPDHPSVRTAVEYFSTSLHRSIQESLLRSSRYKDMIDATLDRHGLPRGLAYLPVIESGYVTTLTSRAGARGIWQFMPGTATRYGLRVDWWIDERAHAEKSTRAAAQYLHDLYVEFGDWPLTLAAYNCGPGKVRQALERFGASTFWHLQARSALPRETRGYVPTFYATLQIVSDPDAYGFQLTDSSATDAATVEIDGPVSLEFVAATAGVDEKIVRAMNPELRRGIVPPERYELRVPPQAQGLLASRASKLREEDPLVAIARFTMRKGDSLASLARQIDVDSDEILQMNGIRSAMPGQTIYLPLRQQELSARLQAERYHIVNKGDTLYSIARANGLTVAELRELNQLNRKHVIRAGQRLRVSIRSAVLAGN